MPMRVRPRMASLTLGRLTLRDAGTSRSVGNWSPGLSVRLRTSSRVRSATWSETDCRTIGTLNSSILAFSTMALSASMKAPGVEPSGVRFGVRNEHGQDQQEADKTRLNVARDMTSIPGTRIAAHDCLDLRGVDAERGRASFKLTPCFVIDRQPIDFAIIAGLHLGFAGEQDCAARLHTRRRLPLLYQTHSFSC